MKRGTLPITIPAAPMIQHVDNIPIPAITVITTPVSTDITVTWPQPFTNPDYTATKPLVTTGGALIGKMDATVVAKSLATCTVRVTATTSLPLTTATLSALAYQT